MKADICYRNTNSTITVSWDETVCSLVENYQCFRAICCLQLSWRWRQKVILKHWQLPIVLHGIKLQKAVIFIFPITRTSNPTYLQGFLHHWITEEGSISQNWLQIKIISKQSLQYVPPKCWYLYGRVYGVITQKPTIKTTTKVTTLHTSKINFFSQHALLAFKEQNVFSNFCASECSFSNSDIYKCLYVTIIYWASPFYGDETALQTFQCNHTHP
jgi:hypothetical protein